MLDPAGPVDAVDLVELHDRRIGPDFFHDEVGFVEDVAGGEKEIHPRRDPVAAANVEVGAVPVEAGSRERDVRGIVVAPVEIRVGVQLAVTVTQAGVDGVRHHVDLRNARVR